MSYHDIHRKDLEHLVTQIGRKPEYTPRRSAGQGGTRRDNELKVTPMSLYRYIDGKEALPVAMVDVVFEEMSTPTVGNEWHREMSEHAHSARLVLLRHPWALGLVDTPTNPGPATLARHDAVIGTLRAAGFPVPLAARAFAAFDAYVYGFVLQEVSLPLEEGQQDHDTIQAFSLDAAFDDLPHLKEMTIEYFFLDGYQFGDEFDFGLSLVLDGLASHQRCPRREERRRSMPS